MKNWITCNFKLSEVLKSLSKFVSSLLIVKFAAYLAPGVIDNYKNHISEHRVVVYKNLIEHTYELALEPHEVKYGWPLNKKIFQNCTMAFSFGSLIVANACNVLLKEVNNTALILQKHHCPDNVLLKNCKQLEVKVRENIYKNTKQYSFEMVRLIAAENKIEEMNITIPVKAK